MERIHHSKQQTPFSIASANEVYSIPIYQRLFEWDEARIIQLLDDMLVSFEKDPNQPYYVGMLTSNNNNELIDGQQRFTVMMLLGLALSEYYADWNNFVFTKNGEVRLHFIARSNDNAYLHNRCSSDSVYENLFMKRGLDCIRTYMINMGKNGEVYARFVFEKLTFFISRLPNEYAPKALNKYFETMNSTGKNLENHEILKVKMLQATRRFDKVLLTRIWNAVSDMDQKLIRRRRKDERQQDLIWRFQKAYEAVAEDNIKDLFDYQYINSLSNESIDGEDYYPTVGDIEASSDKPSQQRLSRNNGFHSILSFSEFVLQVLWLNLDEIDREGISVNTFFDVNKLQETFKQYWEKIDADEFILSLLQYRLLFDRYVISISNEDSAYDLDASSSTTDEEGSNYHDVLLMYESMLYVNSSAMSYYLWLPSLLAFVDDYDIKDCKEIYDNIKTEDEIRHPLKEDLSLSYSEVDRYWFWKLDFYIWKHRKTIFTDENIRSVADAYTFRRNRSIEHIAPQTPDEDSTLRLSDDVKNCFGNLVMISSAQNSSLTNSTFEIKRAKVWSHINKELNGTIESLKMLMIYQYEAWNKKNIKNHLEECLNFLKKSFD